MPSKEVYIISTARTPLGSFRGALIDLTSVQLGSFAIKGAIERAGIKPDVVEEVYFGCVQQAGLGANVARQASVGAGIPVSIPATTVNKVCASGMKAIMIAAQTIQAGNADILVAGGVDSLSNAPYYLARGETPYGGVTLIDGLISDGISDPFSKNHVGVCAENTAKKLSITREDQDNYAIESYKRAAAAASSGLLAKEIVPVTVKGKRGKPDVVISDDEEYKKVNFEKMKTLNPVFIKDGTGTITAANASPLNDGASAVVLASPEAVSKYGLKPLAKIIAYADGEREPIDFPIAPAVAVEKLLAKTGIAKESIAQWEVNEAFSVVALANIKLLGLDPAKVNPYGGGVSLGHPLGCSGARITGVLALHLQPGQYGCAAICNGGGGSSALIVEKL